MWRSARLLVRAAAFGLAIAAASAVLSFRPIYEPDLWWHLAQGRENATGRLVRTNVFSFTHPDYRQHYTPWLFDTLLYRAWTATGGSGIQAVQAFVLALALVALCAACRARAPAWSTAIVLALGFFVLEPRAIPRPHLVSFAGLAACSLIVERASARRSPMPLIWAIPLVALWSNLHVECVFGVLLIGIFAAAELVRPAALSRRDARAALGIAAICALATMANPYGWGLAAYLYENSSVPRILTIAELRSPYLPEYRAFYFYVVVTGVLLAWSWRTASLREFLTFATFGLFGVLYLRLTPLVLFATAPLLASRLAALRAGGIDWRAILTTGLALALVSSRVPLRLLVTEREVGTQAVAPEQFFSSGAVAFIRRAGLQGHVFNSHNLGGYLAWELYPRVLVFQDSRLQAYPPDHFRSIMAASRSQSDWDVLVSDVDWAVISVPRPNQLSGHGRFPGGEWASVFLDRAVEITVRRAGRYAHLVPAGGP